MNKNKPVRLHKKEPLTVEYEETTVILTGAIFILTLVVLAFVIGTDSLNYLFWSCIWMVRPLRTVRKTFNNYTSETEAELEELSKLKLMVANGSITKKEIQLSIDRPEAIEVRIYNLSNFSTNTYSDFNKRIKSLVE